MYDHQRPHAPDLGNEEQVAGEHQSADGEQAEAENQGKNAFRFHFYSLPCFI
jgi:hypothetical protein